MKTQLLTAAILSSIAISSVTCEAGGLSFAMSTLKSTQRTYTRPRAESPVSTSNSPQTLESPAPQLMLGAFLQDVSGGLQVVATVPGSPAEQALEKGDVIRRVSALGQETRTITTMIQFEYAKREIGADRQAVLEIFRPGTGITYVWVNFRPAGELATFDSDFAHSKARSMFDNLTDSQVNN